MPATPGRLMRRIDELTVYPGDWSDGRGKALPRAGLAWFRGLVVALLSRGCPCFALFPRHDNAEAVQIEWVFGPWAIDVEMNLVTRTAQLFATHGTLPGAPSAELDFSLRPGGPQWRGVDSFLRTVKAYQRAGAQ
jgi:hypothetical protein